MGLSRTPGDTNWVAGKDVSPELIQAMGKAGERGDLIAYAERQLKIQFDEEQRAVLQKMDHACGVTSTFAGAGKTMVLLGQVLMIIRDQPGDSDRLPPLVVVTTASKSMADQVHRDLDKAHPGEGHVARVGFHKSKNMDMLHDFLDKAVTEASPALEAILASLDRCIYLLEQVLRPLGGARAECMVLLRHLHARRHEFMHKCYYPETARSTRLAIDKIRVLVCTYTMLGKLQAALSRWSKRLKDRRYLGLLCDEYQGQPIEKLASLLVYDFFWCYGDPHQLPSKTEPGSRNKEGIAPSDDDQCVPQKPLQWHRAGEWFNGNRTAQKLPLTSTYRFSDVVVGFLQTLQPDIFGTMRCSPRIDHTTLLIPMLFRNVPELLLRLDGTMIAAPWGMILGIRLPSGGGHLFTMGRWAAARLGEVGISSPLEGGQSLAMERVR